MEICYYPGCTLKSQAVKLDQTARKVALKLGVEMKEIENWQCCGAEYPTATDEIASKLSAVRALDYAKNHGGKLLTLCSACHNVIKRVNDDMKNDENVNFKANNYLALDERYNGETEVIHYLELLRDYVGFDKIKEKVTDAFKGKKIGAYYGCLLLRPSSVLAFDNPENPKIIEDFIKAIGGTAVIYPFRNECCGAYVSPSNKALTIDRCNKVMDSASQSGAEILVTACPLCKYNLTENSNNKVEVKYFTELLFEALGGKL
jgi:heterodisulfide reductase subunit B